MLRICCCCCFSGENLDRDDAERQPLLHPDPDGRASARSAPPGRRDAGPATGKLAMRRLCVPELDQRFTEMAEAFNEQREHHETMVRRLRNVRKIYGCDSNDGLALTECVKKIREEHGEQYRVSLKLIGYDFSLNVVPVGSSEGHPEEGHPEEGHLEEGHLEEGHPEEPLPPHLKLAQSEFREASASAKATVSKGTALQELIGWLLRSAGQMEERVKGAASTYPEQRRLVGNLEANVKEARRAKELSQGYRARAAEVLSEVARIAGTPSVPPALQGPGRI